MGGGALDHENQIPFNRSFRTGLELNDIRELLGDGRLHGAGKWTQKCEDILAREIAPSSKVLLTPSCTAALEMSALILGIQPGDEVLMPSYTFVSTANAFALRGARIKFVDVEPQTMNIDAHKIESSLTDKSRALVVVHYGGVACEMDTIVSICKRRGLALVEDAAQAIGCSYKGQPLGSFGELGCFSFHETKNIHCGEGGALVVNRSELNLNAEMIREKGTNRSQYLRGQVDKYTWQCLGSSYLTNEISAAFLFSQLSAIEKVNRWRSDLWQIYFSELSPLAERGVLDLPHLPPEVQHNGHLFFVKLKGLDEREHLRQYLLRMGIHTSSHYEPLHMAPAGIKYGEFCGEDEFTTSESQRLLRLPLYYDLGKTDVLLICEKVRTFFG